MTFRLCIRATIVALIGFTAACATDSPTAPATSLALGDWGGDRADVNASATATHVSLNCSFGDFAGNIALDANGRFAVNGSYNRSVGPVLLNGNMPAQLSGQVTGNSLTFAIAVNDTIAKQIYSFGPATVVFGKQPSIQVCPV
jgi:hypothetical protein